MSKKIKVLTALLLLIVLLISGISYGRYVLNREFSANSSSIPFYFDAETTTPEVIIEDQDGIIKIIIKNYDSLNRVTSKNLSYEISLREEDEEKFEMNYSDSSALPGGEKTDSEVKLSIKPREDATLGQTEEIVVLVTSTSPYKKVIEIPIIVYVELYKVKYEVYFENDDYWLTEDDAEHDGITLDTIFGEDRPRIILNGTYTFNVNIPSKYTGDTYSRNNGTYNKLKYKIVDRNGNELEKNGNCPTYTDSWGVDGECPLGAEIVYKDGTVDIDSTKGPAVYLLSATYYNNSVTEDREIVVKLNEKYIKGEDEKPKEKPYFDATYALNTQNMSGRGASGSYNGDTATNIQNEDPRWNWASFATDKKEMTYNEETDSYSFTWVFQTNSTSNWGFLLNALELNGVGLTIPFIPCLGVNMSGSLNGIEFPVKTSEFRTDGTREIDQSTCAVSRKTTVLPDGAEATLKYIKVFGTQRVYELEITGAHSNVVVTGGNINMYGGGAPEVVIYSLSGIDEDNLYASDGEKVKKSSVLVDLAKYKNVSFKLMPHYENPYFELTNIHGDPIEGGSISYNESSGLYTINNLPQLGVGVNSNYRVGLLTINGKAIRYAIKYLPGEIGSNASLSTWYDDNNGSYYTIENSSVVSVLNERPFDTTGKKTFSNWTINNKDTIIPRGEILTLNYLLENSVVDENGVHVLELVANWE